MTAGTVNLNGGTDRLTLSSTGNNTPTISNVETLVGGDLDDKITLGAALAARHDRSRRRRRQPDAVRTAPTRSRSPTSRRITGGTGADTITLGKAPASGAIDLGAGTADKLTLLANGANTLTVSNVETITGGTAGDVDHPRRGAGLRHINLGTGTDSLTLSSAGTNTLTVSAVETITGGSGADTITLGAALVRRHASTSAAAPTR